MYNLIFMTVVLFIQIILTSYVLFTSDDVDEQRLHYSRWSAVLLGMWWIYAAFNH